jgi:hypothetical protein
MAKINIKYKLSLKYSKSANLDLECSEDDLGMTIEEFQLLTDRDRRQLLDELVNNDIDTYLTPTDIKYKILE